jgi:uncharacterized damage-inducible protein DinB
LLQTVRRLLDHLRWADERALDALRRADSPPPDAIRLFAHVLGAEHVWLTRLRGEPPRVAVWPTLALEECAALARENVTGLQAYAGGLEEEDLRREVSYRTSAGHPFQSTVEDILVHTALHGSYHRGQIALLLRRGGAEPAVTDYIAFVRESAPAPPRAP